jgi:surface protein
MNVMFYGATDFNQDLSQWCVKEIGEKPTDFDKNSAFENKSEKQPQWGECPVVFRKKDNGIVTCSNAPVGSSYKLDGILYTKIEDKFDLIKFNGKTDATQACTTDISDMSTWFSGIADFNKDIRHWDTSTVTNMDYMFNGATIFNQNLSSWCVKKIANKPTDFDTGAGFENIITKQPQWGKCPTKAPASISLAPVYYLLLN